jgi:16S rRNA (guanine1207-N2)-methyltransferase
MGDRSGQYFESSPTVASTPVTVPLVLPDLTVDLHSDRGVFASSHIDVGTKLLLIEGPPPPAEGELLDLGCGYGPIAVTLAHRAPASTVWAVDVNERARALCAQNASLLDLPNVRVVAPEDLPPDLRFAAVYSNPPIRIGKAALHAVLADTLGRLARDGFAVLVVSKHLGADSLARWLGSRGFDAERTTSRQGYRLLRVTLRPDAS